MENVKFKNNRMAMKRLRSLIVINSVFLLILILAFPDYLHANIRTVGPFNCSAAAVNSAINASADGDTIELTCIGTVAWTETVTIPNTKGITLMAPNAYNNWKQNNTNFPLTISSNKDPAIEVNIGTNNSVTRISGIKFRASTDIHDGVILVTGGGNGAEGDYVIDNCYFDTIRIPDADLYGVISIIPSTGFIYGVIKRSTFFNCHDPGGHAGYVISIWELYGRDTNDGDFSHAGDPSWNVPINYGTARFQFIEDCLFQNTNLYARHFIAAFGGARYVVRYSKFDTEAGGSSGESTEMVEGHGLCICSSTGQGVRGGEIYGNEFTGSELGAAINLRGGEWLVYNNTIDEQGWRSGPIWLREYRSDCSPDCTDTCSPIPGWTKCFTDTSEHPAPQQIRNTYLWGNTLDNSPVAAYVVAESNGGLTASYIVEGRDYWESSSLADAKANGLDINYTPYTYPHPLLKLKPPSNFHFVQ
jgi:hypothetical protein